ncbi:tail fiber domain-containing protein, partial [bacterium]|nr:tail fiber domain-containing protein [bacterium]
GGFCIGTNMLCSTPAAGCSVGMSSCNTSAAIAFWAGCSTVASAPFRVTNCGNLYAEKGTIGNWTLSAGYMFSKQTKGEIVLNPSCNPNITVLACGGAGSYAMHGQMFWNNAYKDAFGFSVTNGSTGTLAAGMGYANLGTFALPSGTCIACGCPFFYVGSAANSYAQFYGGVFTVKGDICATSGTFTGAVYTCSGQIATFGIDNYCLESCGINPNGCEVVALHTPLATQGAGVLVEHNQTDYVSIVCLKTTSGSTSITAPVFSYVHSTACYGFYSNGKISVNDVVCSSDRNLKTDFQSVNILHLLRQMPITKWRFKDSKDYHIGPVAQDFNSIFKLNHDWKTNLTVNGLAGIALKAIKEVDENVQTLEKDNKAIREKLQKLECEMAALREMIN